jgi:hypothetical protein
MLPPQGLFLFLHDRVQRVLILSPAVVDAGLMSLSLGSLRCQTGGKDMSQVEWMGVSLPISFSMSLCLL